MIKGFRSQLLAGKTLCGTMLTLPSAAVAEILADAGFDWLFIDCEHGTIEVRDIQHILQAVGHRIACIVRIPECSEGTIKRVLDAGAQGISSGGRTLRTLCSDRGTRSRHRTCPGIRSAVQ